MYAKIIVTIAIKIIRMMLCLSVVRNSLPSSDDAMPVAATATAILCSDTILPITPVAAFDEAVRIGLSPISFAVTTCSVPNNAFEDVSLPVRNTPVQPSIALNAGNSGPVAANASPNVDVMPA